MPYKLFWVSGLEMAAPARQILQLSVERVNRETNRAGCARGRAAMSSYRTILLVAAMEQEPPPLESQLGFKPAAASSRFAVPFSRFEAAIGSTRLILSLNGERPPLRERERGVRNGGA
jgi:hypothetical protein